VRKWGLRHRLQQEDDRNRYAPTLVGARMTETVIRTFEIIRNIWIQTFTVGTSWRFFDKLLMHRGQKP